MKKLISILVAFVLSLSFIGNSFAAIKWVDGYHTSTGQYRSGHFRDTSSDSNPYNNANYLGLND